MPGHSAPSGFVQEDELDSAGSPESERNHVTERPASPPNRGVSGERREAPRVRCTRG
jgi:hypothetical protein